MENLSSRLCAETDAASAQGKDIEVENCQQEISSVAPSAEANGNGAASITGVTAYMGYVGKIDVNHPKTGELRAAYVFIATLGSSRFIYAEATASAEPADWIGSHLRAFEYFGGVPSLLRILNSRPKVAKDCFCKPGPKQTYDEFAAHFKFEVERAVTGKSRKKLSASGNEPNLIFKALRDREFTSIQELNEAIQDMLADLNNARPQEFSASRQELFETTEFKSLLPFPSTSYLYAEWKECGVAFDSHVEIFKNFYSVPYFFIRERVLARISVEGVELFHNGAAIACHARSPGQRVYTTDADHMATTHGAAVDWTPDRFIIEALKIGPKLAKFLERIINTKRFPEQAFRSCAGVLKLQARYGQAR